MRVGVYVDAFNLYYGGRKSCGRGTPGWRWLDIRAQTKSVIGRRLDWPGATIDRLVYCTARVGAADNPSGHADQGVYLNALLATGSVDYIEHGYYVARVKSMPLAIRGPNDRPQLVFPRWPVMIQDAMGSPITNALFMASVLQREEKGSDVNVAAHLLRDVFERRIDAAVVISNDSDLRLPIQMARELVPVGLVNPTPGQTAGALRGEATSGAGRHFWYKLIEGDFRDHQLPDPAGGYRKPKDW